MWTIHGGAMRRKGTGIPCTPALRACRFPLAVLAVILAVLLGGASTAAGVTALATTKAGQPAGTKSAQPAGDTNEEKTKRENERGKARGSAHTSIGVPRHGGRPLPHGNVDRLRHGAEETDPVPAHRSTKAASRPERLPVLHCVFRC
ncbi:hypothetical protein ACGFOU_20655 [Streptomyces sp. NPDC048595]|uniref:hypothetical protein n=1 Tax=Streptomyces sp. NPDC048595 TaxID=3365576 RepID=UPI0037234DC3